MKQMEKIKVAIGMVMIAGIFSMNSDSFAGSNNATLRISATVQARISQTLVKQEKAFSVTREDVAKGYVDITAATVLQVKTNDRNGYMLSFAVNGTIAKEVWVFDNNRTTILSGDGGFVHQAYPGPAGEVKELGYRIFLAPGTQAGLYAWPLSIIASLQ
jgi:hypothetical protein